METKNEIKEQIKRLIELGRLISTKEFLDKKKIDNADGKYSDIKNKTDKIGSVSNEYQKWYTTSLSLIKSVYPDRLKEFKELYILEKRDSKKIDCVTYTISDYLLGVKVTKEEFLSTVDRFDHFVVFIGKFETQISILKSINSVIDSILYDIEGVLQSNLFDNEIITAYDLLKKNHIRAAGAVSGVVLENHLKTICDNHNISFRKKNTTLSDYLQGLKDNTIIDTPNWRFIQRLSDIRNYCVHSKDRDPTKDEVEELIKGTEKIIKTVF